MPIGAMNIQRGRSMKDAREGCMCCFKIDGQGKAMGR